MQYQLIRFFLAVAIAAGGAGAFAKNKALEVPAAEKAPLTQAAFDAAKAAIDRQLDVDKKACDRLRGNAADVCHAQAQGKQKADRALLEARYKPGPDAAEAAKFATADANFEVEKVKCEARKGKARSRCVAEAKAGREAARRQARVEKVESTGGIYGEGGVGKAAAKLPKS
ncbi:MAG TPA: hypothetical protein VF522_10005 [Ramlibacter sp.]|uniref:hypothetical protein n=1 Tax=Ramlibacter sp. TaxID=1917967 RepID=UPI002ED0A659